MLSSLLGEDSPAEGHGNSLQYSCLENPMEMEAWEATVHAVAKSQTQLSNLACVWHSLIDYGILAQVPGTEPMWLFSQIYS